MMNTYLLLEISILFQMTALIIAIWLIRVTGKRKAWVLIAAGLAVMTGHQVYSLIMIYSGNLQPATGLTGYFIELLASILFAGGMAFALPLIQSIKQSEELQIDINRSLRMFTLSNEAIISATDELSLLQYICRVIHEVGKYRLAWVGYTDGTASGKVHPVAHSGFREIGREVPSANGVNATPGINPVNTALRTGKPAICNNSFEDPAFEGVRSEARELGYVSMISIPLATGNRSFGVLNIYSEKPDSFTLSEVKLLQEMTDDLVYGITALRAREEHKRIEAELARSEERVKASIENMPDAFSIFSAIRDAEGTIRDFSIDYVNAATCKICGIGSSELDQARMLEILPDYMGNALFAEYCRVVETGMPLNIDKWSIRLDKNSNTSKETRTYNIRAIKLEDGLVVTWRDITEIEHATEALRASESRYLTIFNTASVPICVEDFSEVKKALNSLKSSGITDLRQYMDEHPEFEHHASQKIKILDVNEAAISLYEADDKEELLASVEKIFLPETSPLLRDMLVAMMDEADFFEGETVNRTLKGKKINIWIRITIPAVASEFESLLVSILDITERRKMEEELLRSQKLESLGVLAGGIAHDFNNMLTVILGNIVLAKMKLDQESDVFVRLDKAENAINRAMELTRSLLTFSKVGELTIKPVDMGELIRDAVMFALSGSKSRCEFSIPDDLWPVEADAGQIRQVMENLVINADQAMPRGGTITVRCENIVPPYGGAVLLNKDRCIKISVADQGKGVSPEIREKIFDPYFTTKEGKSGLGLATASSIVSKHGGQLLAETSADEGAVFSIYLPAIETPVRAKEIERKSSKDSRRVLVMDDEEEVREVAEGILTSIGYEITQAKDGAEALDLYLNASRAGRPFDVVILDLTVSGGMGGKETVTKLLEIDKNVTAIVSTGYTSDPVITEYMKFGFKGALNKPYKLEELDEILSSVLNA